MTLVVKNRKQNRRSVRTWVRCDECGMYGAYTVKDERGATDLFDLMMSNHRRHCPTTRAAL